MRDVEDSHSLAFQAGRAALKHSQTFDEQSNLTKKSPEGCPPCEVRWTDMWLGDILGKGTFNYVQEVKIVNCCCQPEHQSSECSRVRGKPYAVKLLKASVKGDRKAFEEGAVDLVNEAKLLTHLKHENIIGLHGVAPGCPSESFLANSCYFLVLEHLDITLDVLLKRLKVEEQALLTNGSLLTRLRSVTRVGPSLTEPQKARLQDIGISVAKAMQFLHEHCVIYRDLKPSNVGVDISGKVKLFDFGLARELVDENVRLTAHTGTLRYMAREVNLGDHYSFPADVYSFGIFLWEVMTLEVPYASMKPREFHDLVVNMGVRPPVNGKCGPKSLQEMIRQCWDPSPKARPSFDQVTKIMLSQISSSNSSKKDR